MHFSRRTRTPECNLSQRDQCDKSVNIWTSWQIHSRNPGCFVTEDQCITVKDLVYYLWNLKISIKLISNLQRVGHGTTLKLEPDQETQKRASANRMTIKVTKHLRNNRLMGNVCIIFPPWTPHFLLEQDLRKSSNKAKSNFSSCAWHGPHV